MNDKTIRSLACALRQSGLKETVFSSQTVELKEHSEFAIARLHCLPGTNPETPALPGLTGQCVDGDPDVLCLRPGEWLFCSESASPAELVNVAANAVDQKRGAVYNLSDGLAVFRLSGDGSAWLLSKLSGLDYLAGRHAGPHCARTRMGHVAVTVHYHATKERLSVFDLIVDRSHARYLWELLLASAPHADDLAGAFGGAE